MTKRGGKTSSDYDIISTSGDESESASSFDNDGGDTPRGASLNPNPNRESSTSSESSSENSSDKTRQCGRSIRLHSHGTDSPSFRMVLLQLLHHLADLTSTNNVRLGHTRQHTRRLRESLNSHSQRLVKEPVAIGAMTVLKEAVDKFVDDLILDLAVETNTQVGASKSSIGKVNDLEQELACYEDVRSSPYRAFWEEILSRELNGPKATDTLSLSTKHADRKAISAKWIFRWKCNNYNSEAMPAKARLVAKDFSQKECLDYFETFVPNSTPSSIRLVAAVGVERDMEQFHLVAEEAFVR